MFAVTSVDKLGSACRNTFSPVVPWRGLPTTMAVAALCTPKSNKQREALAPFLKVEGCDI
jgi:hypothetical protein